MAVSEPRPFVDSTVLFPRPFGSGTPAVILDHRGGGRLTIVRSQPVRAETSGMMRGKRPRLWPRLGAVLRKGPPQPVDGPTADLLRVTAGCSNVADAAVVDAAITSGADGSVSGNTRRDAQPAAFGRGRPDPGAPGAGSVRGNRRPVVTNDVDGGRWRPS
ncbi:MAG: hypothetical protein AVDCRST_MAG19-2473 [uncultured Thermomicrobiales bacterium]|uniref:Uncharacterized protein n=1 Tax=uncultured Thermomicrobiales bacterium TaxID=1645740 RepID=A0A6J4V6V8_9BACT|nr:MAG: hypothetical protein AVDCRST_MAG19-2473 [uncultured Thermomicrobiales bacterium]